MNKDFNLKYRNKTCHIPRDGYRILIKQFLINPEEMVKRSIDLFLESNILFESIHVFVSVRNDGSHIVNLMARE